MLGKEWGNCIKDGAATFGCFPVVFENIVIAALVFAGVGALFFIVFSGIKFILSGGDPKQVESARNTLTWAIIGLVVVLSSFFIISLIGYITRTSEFLMKFGFQP